MKKALWANNNNLYLWGEVMTIGSSIYSQFHLATIIDENYYKMWRCIKPIGVDSLT